MTQDFLETLKLVLEVFPRISEEDVNEAIVLIKQHYKQELASLVSKSGRCFHCRQEISYIQPPAVNHVKQGNDWLNKKIYTWKKPVKIRVDADTQTISTANNLSIDTAKKYICSNCWHTEIEPCAKQALLNKAQEMQRSYEEAKRREAAILSGEKHSTPSKAYWLLCKKITPKEIEQLKSMPYGSFLKTRYWEIVRNYVLYKRGEKCHLCPNTNCLQVHHRVYEHRGSEIFHLKVLIVLCRYCHAKHHNKLERV